MWTDVTSLDVAMRNVDFRTILWFRALKVVVPIYIHSTSAPYTRCPVNRLTGQPSTQHNRCRVLDDLIQVEYSDTLSSNTQKREHFG